MTGQEVGNLLRTKIGEFGSGYIDDLRLNDFFLNSITDITDKKVEEFQQTQKITREMQPLITGLTGLTPATGGIIDLSQTSTQVPNYYSPISVNVTSPYRGASISKWAEERRYDTFIDNYTEGDARYPRFYMAADIMTIEPSNATAVDLNYFVIPIPIDVSDNSAQVPYNDKLIFRIIDNVINVIGVEERDEFNIQVGNQSQAINP